MVKLTATCVLLLSCTAAAAESSHIDPSKLAAVTESIQSAVTSQKTSLENAISQSPTLSGLKLDAQQIAAQRVVAISGDRAEVVSATNLDKLVSDHFSFVEPTGAITRTAVPAILAGADAATTRSYKMGYQITAWDNNRSSLKLDVWARDSTGLSADGPNGYAGDFSVALTSATDPNAHTQLMNPINIAIGAIGASSIVPKPVQIRDLATWHDVAITVPEIAGDTFPVTVSASPVDDGNQVDLAVVRPRISLSSTPPSIVGYGIGVATVDVNATGMRSADQYRVRLSSSEGSLGSGYVTLDATGHGTIGLRSDSARGTTISVSNEGVTTEPITVDFESPWLFLALAIAGGLTGAFLRGRGRQHRARALAIGAASAVVMVLAHAIGIDWVARVLNGADIAWGGEAQVFVLGAIAALVGVSALVPGEATHSA